MSVVDFPQSPARPDLLVGPFEYWKVVVDGRAIPHLTGFHDGGGIALVVDGRFAATFPPELAHQAARLIANAMAVAEGYPHMGATSKEQPFAPQPRAPPSRSSDLLQRRNAGAGRAHELITASCSTDYIISETWQAVIDAALSTPDRIGGKG
jgi:hypothetical protein